MDQDKVPGMVAPVRPSETTDFIRCPRLWHYKHVGGWQPPASTWTPERLAGTAIHAGVAAYWLNQRGRVVPMPPPAECLVNVLRQEWPPDAPLEFSRDALESHALKVLDKVLTWITKEMADAEPIMVEQTLRADGCTPDLVTREPAGLTVTDWKYSAHIDPDRVRYRLENIDRTHQFLDYCWQVGQTLNEPVRQFRKVVIVGGPRIMVREATFTPTQPMLEQWLTGARQMWEDMAAMRAGTKVAYQREAGCRMYGPKWPCTYEEACWTCHSDPVKMAQFYSRAEG